MTNELVSFYSGFPRLSYSAEGAEKSRVQSRGVGDYTHEDQLK